MTKTIDVADKNRFEEIKRQLLQIGSKESEFIRVELLFYEALTISRHYGEELAENKLLAALKHLEANEYGATRQKFIKSKQMEKVIRQFISEFKNVLTHGIKNDFMQSAS
jgi:hypothetical protein